jgi:hypothetical protein
MANPKTLRRLIDLAGVADLETKALMNTDYAQPEARAEFAEIDQVVKSLFGLTTDEAGDVPRPAGWDHIEGQPVAKQVFAFEDAGWDVTDNRRRPLRMLSHYAAPLWLAIRGVAGSLPFQAPDEDRPDAWGSSLAADVARFKKR